MRYHRGIILGITCIIIGGAGTYAFTQKMHTDTIRTAPPDVIPETVDIPSDVSSSSSAIEPLEKPITMPPSHQTTVTEKTPTYGHITSFSENTPLTFPDFTITYTGTRTEKLAVNQNLTFTFYDFSITGNDGRTRTLSWSSGTGVIAPKPFVVDNQLYALELKFAEKSSQQLAETELVISRTETDTFGTKVGVPSYLFQLIAQLTPLTTQTYDTIVAILGFSFTQKPIAALIQSVYESAGFGPITHAELRMSRMSDSKKLLVLTIDPAAHVQKSDITAQYPQATTSTSAYARAHTALSMPGIFGYGETWGIITFGFDTEDRLTHIIVNSLD